MRYHIELAYNGSAFHGWQRQPNAVSVQQILEERLGQLLHTTCQIVGCGRTDAGVHSSRYIAHFEYSGDRSLDDELLYHLNCCLPKEIAVYDISPSDKHARFDALSREYQYFIARIKNPYKIQQQWLLTTQLDTEAMTMAAHKLLSFSDFSSFAKTGSDNKTNICKITKAEWSFGVDNYIFTITADRFLRGMVRTIVGTLVDVGRRKITPEQFVEIIEAKDRSKASASAPADGLFLTDIIY